jgi:stage V sporulation protein B
MTVIGTDAVAFALRDRQIGLPVAQGAHLTIRLSRINVIVGAASFAALAAVSGIAVPLVYGHAYRGAVTALYALGPGVIALASMRAVSAHLVRLERPGVFAALTGISAALNAALNVALIPRMGIVGASLASSVSYVVLAVACLTWLCRSVGAPLMEVAPRWRDVVDIWEAGRQLIARYLSRSRIMTPTPSGQGERD